jgi:hypothetical protein
MTPPQAAGDLHVHTRALPSRRSLRSS